jgi:hypothetical protein
LVVGSNRKRQANTGRFRHAEAYEAEGERNARKQAGRARIVQEGKERKESSCRVQNSRQMQIG